MSSSIISSAPTLNAMDLERLDTSPDDNPAQLPAYLTQSDVERPKSLVREAAFVFILCMAQFMTQAALAQAIVPARIIGASFGTTNPGERSWFPAAYSLTVGTFILIAGRLGDLFGHKKLFIMGFAWFGLWSLLAGFSVYSNKIFFDCCRAFQGIGCAFTLPNALAILGRSYKPGKRKQMVFSILGATCAQWIRGRSCVLVSACGIRVVAVGVLDTGYCVRTVCRHWLAGYPVHSSTSPRRLCQHVVAC